MSLSIQSSQSSNVLFWEGVLEIELSKVSTLLEKKQTRLLTLRSLPFNEQSESNCRAAKLLETELLLLLGLIGALEELKNAYLEFTASVADSLISLTTQRNFYRQELLESIARGGAYQL